MVIFSIEQPGLKYKHMKNFNINLVYPESPVILSRKIIIWEHYIRWCFNWRVDDPIALVGNQLGQKIGKKFNMKTLRIVVISALGIMGLVYIIHPILK